jgi:hypothetical protein
MPGTWTTPVDRAAGYTVTNTDWNTNLGANGDTAFLYGDTGWTNVGSFTNSWTAGGVAPGYILIGRVVYVRGIITGGTINLAAFTLPSGYRPSLQWYYATVANAAFGYGTVTPAGVVTPVAGSTTNHIVCFTFPTV